MRPQRPSLGWWKRQQEDVDINDFEQGRKVAIALFRENTRSMETLGNLLINREFSGRDDVQLWEKRNAYVPTPYEPVHLVEHGLECPCDGCVNEVLRASWDIIGLPRKAAMGGRLK